MPNYDFICQDCRKRFVVFLTYAEYGKTEVRCAHCQSTRVTRKIGRVRVARSDASRLENMADPNELAGIDEDPRALGRMMREMSSEIGEDMGPEFHEVVGRLEKGPTPSEIERDIPNIGDDAGGTSAGDDLL
jgi:putative FmdB family regulatory protein